MQLFVCKFYSADPLWKTCRGSGSCKRPLTMAPPLMDFLNPGGKKMWHVLGKYNLHRYKVPSHSEAMCMDLTEGCCTKELVTGGHFGALYDNT